MNHEICQCPSCDWVGIKELLVHGEACPICNDYDITINEMILGFSMDGDYKNSVYVSTVEELTNAIRIAENIAKAQLVPWREDGAVIHNAKAAVEANKIIKKMMGGDDERTLLGV